MSLNCEEIDLILKEFPLEGLKIQNIYQPTFDSIIFELYGHAELSHYLLSIAHNASRIHPLSAPRFKNERPLRFMECLRSRIRGGTILCAEQLGKDRIVRIKIVRSNEKGNLCAFYLYCRLWTGAGNIILVSDDNIIIDSLRRLPSRNEVSGKHFSIPKVSETDSRSKAYAIREFDYSGPFWQRIEHFYEQSGGQLSRESLLENAHEIYNKKKLALEARLSHLESTAKEYGQFERFRQIGDILLSGYALENHGKKSFAHAFDFYAHEEILIEIDQKLTPAQNSALYYEKYHKAKSGILETQAEISRTADSLERLRDWMAKLEREPEPLAIAKALRMGGTVRTKQKSKYPCMNFNYKGWTILVGRSGKENDEILRHHCKGNDLWLHARDYSGAYVFIKSQKNKSISPEALQAAAKLAIYYSKARKNLEGNVHSTFAKNLKRVKEGPLGKVIPYLEKNLYITFTEADMKNIFEQSIAHGEENDQ